MKNIYQKAETVLTGLRTSLDDAKEARDAVVSERTRLFIVLSPRNRRLLNERRVD